MEENLPNINRWKSGRGGDITGKVCEFKMKKAHAWIRWLKVNDSHKVKNR